MNMIITKSKKTDHIKLTTITKKSKAYWGYSQQQIKIWDRELTLTKEYIDQNEVYSLVIEGRIIGYYSYLSIGSNKVKLDNLFILPDFIGKQLGTRLMEDFLMRVKEKGFTVVTLDSEPNSENFYKKLGFRVVGQLATSIKDRYMPIMEKDLQ